MMAGDEFFKYLNTTMLGNLNRRYRSPSAIKAYEFSNEKVYVKAMALFLWP